MLPDLIGFTLLRLLTTAVPLVILMIVAGVIFRYSAFGRSLAARLEDAKADHQLLQDLASDLRQLESGVAGMEQRLDFAERKLVETTTSRPGANMALESERPSSTR